MGTRHLLRPADLDRATIECIFGLAAAERQPDGFAGALPPGVLAAIFELPSTRTRLAFAAAAHRLGLAFVPAAAGELQLGRGEDVADTARALSAMAAAVVVRTRSHELLECLASASSVPVVNALSPQHHPCEALVSLFTLEQHFGRLEGIRLAFVGAINNVSRSLVEASVALGVQVRLACPPAYATEEASEAEVFDDPREAVDGADAVYTDVWQSMGDEEDEQLERVFAGFQVDEALMRHAAAEAVFMHCLPARRGFEVASDVIDGPRSLVWKQVANHVPVTAAILYTLIGDDVSVR